MIYPEWLEAIKPLTGEERGELLTLILTHTAGEEAVPTSPVVAAAWGFVRASIDANNDRYEELCERRRAAVNARWERERERKARESEEDAEEDASVYKSIQEDTSVYIQNQNQNQNQNQCSTNVERVNNAPAREEVVKFFLDNSATVEQAERFFNYWAAAGWIRGATPLKAWQPSARQWILEDYRKQSQQPKTQANGRNKGTAGGEIAAAEDYTDKF